MDRTWIKTKEMAEHLGCHRQTLLRLKRQKFFSENNHWTKINPTMPRSDFLWHYPRVMLKMNRL